MRELTQLSMRHYTPPSTGAIVPLLHITPSKLDTGTPGSGDRPGARDLFGASRALMSAP
ncbi:hypothetical protein [Micromonospora sp. CPCC 205556]|uniref:hypothetical protein n=1 Tax=Micromonospora sp. CPCC 205556 TaxID=3122398 RepID=UPI002FF1F0D2